ncbi:HD domain-containing phosphohydrolase [Desulfobacula phenolica]|uniref:HDIG domain-containing protein n=1 Tax=Desulfobacula phenolica TaxID=90732 RepID=A0A1H2DSX8_9BACT|nr:HD domain-containing phosphohydrolase [Desulfobacula phenolica]SDT85965.1 HDIG domain-containing protein [Desulfobacula phenolica]
MRDDPIKILIVDDEEGILEVTEGYFQRKGYDVYTACNGIEALEVLNRVKIGCVFTDINMPMMDGLELAEKIRAHESTLPVVVMTGCPSLENSIQTLKNGVVDYLIKPMNLEQMELTLKRILRERELFVENLILKEEVERQERLKKLNHELLERIDEVNTLNRVMEDFSSTDSSYGIFNKVVDLGVEELKADKVFFHLYSEQEKSLALVASSDCGIKDETVCSLFGSDFSTNAHEFILDFLSTDHTPCLISEVGKNERLDDVVHSLMLAPLKIRDKIFGIASAFSFRADKFFNEKDIYYMSFITRKAAAAIENIALYENIYDNLFSTLYAFVTALEVRDLYTRKHSTRVAKYAHMIAVEMQCNEEELDIISFAGSLHDIGKIGIRDDILLKPGRLTDDEYEKIKEHPVIGADIISKLGLWDREMKIIRHHHERFDGKGYPDGLKGEQIPKLARILCVADSFDAMASDRAYRKKMKKSKVLDIIKENSGTQFDPIVVEAFLKVANQEFPDDF